MCFVNTLVQGFHLGGGGSERYVSSRKNGSLYDAQYTCILVIVKMYIGESSAFKEGGGGGGGSSPAPTVTSSHSLLYMAWQCINGASNIILCPSNIYCALPGQASNCNKC